MVTFNSPDWSGRRLGTAGIVIPGVEVAIIDPGTLAEAPPETDGEVQYNRPYSLFSVTLPFPCVTSSPTQTRITYNLLTVPLPEPLPFLTPCLPSRPACDTGVRQWR